VEGFSLFDMIKR